MILLPPCRILQLTDGVREKRGKSWASSSHRQAVDQELGVKISGGAACWLEGA